MTPERTSGDLLDRQDRIERIVWSYLRARDAGERPDPSKIVAEHPDLADDLAAIFAAERASVAPADSASQAAEADETFTAPGNGSAYRSTNTVVRDRVDAGASSPHPSASRYRILRAHAKGGLGIVFVARDEECGREVALKEIQTARADDPVSRLRFVMEAEVTGRLEHPGIVPVYGLGTYTDGRPYYAMRFIKGDSLKDALERFHGQPDGDPVARRLAFRNLLRRMVDVCNAVGYAHSRGILHRDLKPSNIMLGPYGETLVVDWGLAKRLDEGVADAVIAARLETAESGTSTVEGHAIGTPGFMSPEQAAGRLNELRPATDVYGLGATLYVVLTGRMPKREPPHRMAASVPAALRAVCAKAMAERVADRYPAAEALATDLERWLADEPVSAYREPWTVRASRWARRHRTTVVAVAILLVASVLALSVATVLVLREQRKTEAAKRLAQENFELALEQSVRSADLIAASEAEFASNPSSSSARKDVLTSASHAFRTFLADRPDDPTMRARAAQVFRYTANAHRYESDLAAAEPLYRDSIALYERLVEEFPDDLAHQQRLAQVLRDWYAFLTRAGRGDAGETLRYAVAVSERVLAASPGDSLAKAALASGLLDLSALEYGRGQVADSGRTAERAARLLREIAPDRPERGTQYAPLLLAGALNRVAIAERDQDRLETAQSAHAEALRIATAVALDRPAGVNSADALHYRARILLDRGRTWSRAADRVKAEACYSDAIRQWTALAGGYPKVGNYRYWQAVALRTRAQLRTEASRPVDARADLDAARGLLERLVADSPSALLDRRELGRVYLELARLAKAMGAPAEAGEWVGKAAATLDRAAQLAPNDREVNELQAQLQAAAGP